MRLRAALLALAGTVALLGAPGPAAATPVLVQEDADELAQALAEATEVQGVCYGWRVTVIDNSGAEGGIDEGSSFGPDRGVASEPCERVVELVASVLYTSELSEAEDSASWSIEARGLGEPPKLAELADLGYTADRLLDEDNDTALVNAVGALPGLVADHGEARAVPFEPERQAPDAAGRPTNRPGSDFLRENGTTLGVLVLITLAGLFWLVTGLRSRTPVTHD